MRLLNDRILISICIPTYEMRGKGAAFLKHGFESINRQKFRDFEVVISDHSKNEDIKKVCEQYSGSFDLRYVRNEEKYGNSSANLNNAIRNAKGKLIKILFQDDFLYSENSLEEIADNFDLEKDKWMVTACEHTIDGKTFIKPFYPRYHSKIHFGRNTISSPSVLTIKNENPLFFDENLVRSMDTDYYKRCYDAFGEPKILNSINVVNRIGSHQVSNSVVNEKLKHDEYKYLLKKYNVRFRNFFLALYAARKLFRESKKFIKGIISKQA